MTLEEVGSRLHKIKSFTHEGHPGLRACCPAHNDGTPSFAVWEGDDGWLHMKCLAGCSEETIMESLGMETNDRRMEQNDLRDTQTQSNSPIYYRYYDTEGNYVFEKVRLRKKDGTKAIWFQCRYKDGEPLEPRTTPSGHKMWPSPDSIKLGNKRYVLYRQAEVAKAAREGRTIYFNEGEKAVDFLWSIGIAATCQAFGANGAWHQDYADILSGCEKVIVIADHHPEGKPPAGEDFAKRFASHFNSAGLPVVVAQSDTLGPTDDAYDHFSAGLTEDGLIMRPDLMPERGLQTVTFGLDFKPVKVEYNWKPYFPKGKCVLLDAAGGVGKTSLCMAIAAWMSNGRTPITAEPCDPLKVLYLHKGEDSSEDLETVYRANGGIMEHIHYYDGPVMLDELGIRKITETVNDGKFDIVVFDAMFYFLEGIVKDTGVALDVVGVMNRLNRMAHTTRASVVDIRHTSKGVVGKKASELGLGSVQFVNSHRGQLVARFHPKERGLVVVTDEKGSILVPKGDAFAYRRVGEEGEVQFVRNFSNPFEENKERSEPTEDQIKENWWTA